MKLVRWTRFTWDLSKLPPELPPMAENFCIRPIGRDEEGAVRNVISSAFSLDSDWGDALKILKDWLDAQINDVFESKSSPCLAITHGARIIGASVLNISPDAVSNLITGPCVLVEYRNRGIGKLLLQHSLQVLRESGLSQAHALTKENGQAARFVYPRFGATKAAAEWEPQLVES